MWVILPCSFCLAHVFGNSCSSKNSHNDCFIVFVPSVLTKLYDEHFICGPLSSCCATEIEN